MAVKESWGLYGPVPVDLGMAGVEEHGSYGWVFAW